MNLENKDSSFFSKKDKSDPYCQIQVGAQLFKTRTINNDLNPVFNECFEAVVDQASGQKLRIELFDEDTAGADEELGRLSIPLEVVRKSGEIEKWFHLEGCKHGELHLRVNWLNLSTNPRNLDRDVWENEWITADKPIHPALLMVFVDSVSNLPYPKANLEPSPFVELSLGRTTQRTPVKVKTVNPLFQTKFLFFVKQPEGQELKLKAFDDGTRRELGELNIPIISIMNQPNMEIFQQTFQLVHGIHSSPVVVTARLRTFVPPENTVNSFDVPSAAYGTGQHIERAEKRSQLRETNNGFQNHTDSNVPLKASSNNNGSAVIQSRQSGRCQSRPLTRSLSSLTASSSTSHFRSGHNFVGRLKAGNNTKKVGNHHLQALHSASYK
uniref:C2 domain-containing protein n=1 Tax=Ditylenchus dipsaci TaxID=166011 RepID=A0A915D948_9BILA